MTVFIFIARAFIAGGFQAAYVYTPEVRTQLIYHFYFLEELRLKGKALSFFAMSKECEIETQQNVTLLADKL